MYVNMFKLQKRKKKCTHMRGRGLWGSAFCLPFFLIFFFNFIATALIFTNISQGACITALDGN
ncbi:hypothetical protein DPX39_010024700 [Trypanosoma brucei equiperdum]|uniref:Uncharacterized protein n=1 Tax=Trypanosoma brucei equiperdum TaxID=630700 RepID=A0A3L6LDC0_9TRYP|nr:hypothetical protein DPX39_010024700 [Trypanosoma brucei equiperdum]